MQNIEISKWYRGYAVKIHAARVLAELNALEIKIPLAGKFSETFPWRRFAESAVVEKYQIQIMDPLWDLPWLWEGFKENKIENTIEATKTWSLCETWPFKNIPISLRTGPQLFVGKSIRQLVPQIKTKVKGKLKSKIAGEMMDEAEHFTLANFFKHTYGYTDIPKNILIDELYRPLNATA